MQSNITVSTHSHQNESWWTSKWAWLTPTKQVSTGCWKKSSRPSFRPTRITEGARLDRNMPARINSREKGEVWAHEKVAGSIVQDREYCNRVWQHTNSRLPTDHRIIISISKLDYFLNDCFIFRNIVPQIKISGKISFWKILPLDKWVLDEWFSDIFCSEKNVLWSWGTVTSMVLEAKVVSA